MPEAAFETLGNQLTEALITGDFDLYARTIALPMRIEPSEGLPYQIPTLSSLEDDFALFHRFIAQNGITDIRREVRDIATPSEDVAEILYLVSFLPEENRVMDPFLSKLSIRRTPDGWRLFKVETSLGHINWTLGKGGF